MSECDLSAIQAGAWQWNKELVFLNHGSFGACPRCVLDLQTRLRAELETSPVQFFLRRQPELLDAARTALARFIGAAADDIVFVRNTTTGINVVLRSLSWKPGDEIVITNHGYNACNNVVSHLAEQHGLRIVTADIPFPIDHPETARQQIASCLSKRTRILLIDHVTSPTGLVFPLASILETATSRGVMTLVDGAHAPGMLPLDITELRPTFYTGNCHKWLCAPKGTAFLYVATEMQEAIQPAVISHGYNTSRPGRSRFHDLFDWPGTDDVTGWLCIPETLAFLNGLVNGGIPMLMKRNHALAVAGRQVLCEALKIQVPCPNEMLGSMATVPLPEEFQRDHPDPTTAPTPLDALAVDLFDSFGVEVPVFSFETSSRKLLRISAHAYNHLDQYRYLADALVALSK